MANTTLTRLQRHALQHTLYLFKLVIGIAIPVKLGSRQSMAIGWNFQYQYAEAQNASQIETYPPIVSRSRDKRDQTSTKSDRALAYLGIESMLER